MIVAAGLFATSDRNPVSAAIRYLTRESWWRVWRLAEVSHVGLWFQWDDGPTVRHEALWGEGWTAKTWQTLEEYAAKGQTVLVGELPWSAPDCEQLYEISSALIGKASYDRRDLLVGHFLTNSIPGRALCSLLRLTMVSDPDKVVCSEGVGRCIVAVRRDWDLRPDPRKTFDALTPQECVSSLRRFGVRFERMGK